MSKIALEEHFVFPDFLGYLSEAMPHVTHKSYDQLIKRLSDFGDERVAAMDAAGVTFAVLSLSGPGVQVEKDTAQAVKRARQANDLLAESSKTAAGPLRRLCASRHAGSRRRS
jgi:2,3-dihydroxybenzoate decarboxylase